MQRKPQGGHSVSGVQVNLVSHIWLMRVQTVLRRSVSIWLIPNLGPKCLLYCVLAARPMLSKVEWKTNLVGVFIDNNHFNVRFLF